MSSVVRKMNSQTTPRSRTPKKMERRTIIISLALAFIVASLLYQKLSTQRAPQEQQIVPNDDTRVTTRPFYSLNGYNPLIRSSKSKRGLLARLKHFFFPEPVSPTPSVPKHITKQYGAVRVAYREHPDPKGVVLLLHGCGESAATWYDLPEHHAIALELYHQRFSTLAVTSANRKFKCWSSRFPAGENDDVGRVLMAVREYYNGHHHPEDFPLHGLGVSSGGSFMSVFSTTGRIISQVLYITPGNRKAFRHSRKGYPRTLFVHAKNDPFVSADAIESAKQELLKRGVNVAIFPQQPPEMTDLLYSTRVPNLYQSHSAKLAAAKDIKAFMKVMVTLPQEFRGGVEQVRKVAEGGHAVSSTGASDIAAWI